MPNSDWYHAVNALVVSLEENSLELGKLLERQTSLEDELDTLLKDVEPPF